MSELWELGGHPGQAEVHEPLVDEDDFLIDEYVCRICGCTENEACEGGCYWVEPGLCSTCADRTGALGGL